MLENNTSLIGATRCHRVQHECLINIVNAFCFFFLRVLLVLVLFSAFFAFVPVVIAVVAFVVHIFVSFVLMKIKWCLMIMVHAAKNIMHHNTIIITVYQLSWQCTGARKIAINAIVHRVNWCKFFFCFVMRWLRWKAENDRIHKRTQCEHLH